MYSIRYTEFTACYNVSFVLTYFIKENLNIYHEIIVIISTYKLPSVSENDFLEYLIVLSKSNDYI